MSCQAFYSICVLRSEHCESTLFLVSTWIAGGSSCLFGNSCVVGSSYARHMRRCTSVLNLNQARGPLQFVNELFQGKKKRNDKYNVMRILLD